MWPDSFAEWWPLVGQRVVEVTRSRLISYRLLTVDGVAPQRVDHIVRLATRAVFDRADLRQVFPGHFPTIADFREWAVVCGYQEALRLLPEQNHVRPWIEQLAADQQRLLLSAYVDQFNDRQFARILTVSPQQAREAVRAAYQAFCDLLRANEYGHDDDPQTFPLPPVLFGQG